MYWINSPSTSNSCGCTYRICVRIGLRIVDHDFDIHVAEVTAPEPFRQSHRLAVRMAAAIEPGLVVESHGLDDEDVAVPFADRVTQPARFRILRMRAAVEEDLTEHGL